MTKKHFEHAARIIRELVDEGYRGEADIAARVFAEVARAHNPRFDTARFLTACGL